MFSVNFIIRLIKVILRFEKIACIWDSSLHSTLLRSKITVKLNVKTTLKSEPISKTIEKKNSTIFDFDINLPTD